MEKNKKKLSRARGDSYIHEATGSATMINLDGQWEYDFDKNEEKK